MNNNPEFSKYALRLIKDLLIVGVYLRREGSRLLNEHSLTQQQFVVLNEIVERGEINQKDIIGNLLFEKSNVSKSVKKLKNLDYIEISTATQDRRVTILKPTERGDGVWIQCIDKLNTWSIGWVEVLEIEDLANVTKIIEKLREYT